MERELKYEDAAYHQFCGHCGGMVGITKVWIYSYDPQTGAPIRHYILACEKKFWGPDAHFMEEFNERDEMVCNYDY